MAAVGPQHKYLKVFAVDFMPNLFAFVSNKLPVKQDRAEFVTPLGAVVVRRVHEPPVSLALTIESGNQQHVDVSLVPHRFLKSN